MFTGMIEELGKVKSVAFKGSNAEVAIECAKIMDGVNLGDSIAVNGVCLTVTAFNAKGFTADASEETLRRTSLKQATQGKTVNLERAMLMGGRFGGHIVQGHVDTVGTVLKIINSGGFWTLTVEMPEVIRKYVSEKGSITVDGISLTVAEDLGASFTIAVIPHTYAETNLSSLKPGDIVNLEVDVISRYVEKLLKSENKEDRLAKLLADM